MDDRALFLERLEIQLDKQDEKIEDIRKKISNINETLIRNTSSLEYHIKRTDILEGKINNIPQKALIYLSIIGAILSIGSRFF